MVHAVHPAGAAARTMAVGRGFRHLRMAVWDVGVFRAVRGAGISLAAASDRGRCPLETAIWATRRRLARGVGEEFCVQSKAQLRRHTGCMARSWAAAMAQKARRHPQTHRW